LPRLDWIRVEHAVGSGRRGQSVHCLTADLHHIAEVASQARLESDRNACTSMQDAIDDIQICADERLGGVDLDT
jgi:hypothetical protein